MSKPDMCAALRKLADRLRDENATMAAELAGYADAWEAERTGAKKLWLWKNYVAGKPEYWAFDNAFPVRMDCDDPQTLGEPCGYALLKPSRPGRTDVSDAEVLRLIYMEQPDQEKTK